MSIVDTHCWAKSTLGQAHTQSQTLDIDTSTLVYTVHAEQLLTRRQLPPLLSLPPWKRSFSLKAKFHYASWFGAGSEPVRSQLRTSCEQASVMEFGFYSLQLDLLGPTLRQRRYALYSLRGLSPLAAAVFSTVQSISSLLLALFLIFFPAFWFPQQINLASRQLFGTR